METNEIREAIMKKARDEAAQIIAESERKVQAMIEKAQEQKKELVEEEKEKRLSEARREAAKILAQSTLKERQTILREKDRVIRDIVLLTREELQKSVMKENQIELLLKEILDAFETVEKIRLIVAAKDLDVIRKVVGKSDVLKEKVAEIKEKSMLGGIIAETTDGMISIDNSFERRLDMLMPKILPEIGKTLFGS